MSTFPVTRLRGVAALLCLAVSACSSDPEPSKESPGTARAALELTLGPPSVAMVPDLGTRTSCGTASTFFLGEPHPELATAVDRVRRGLVQNAQGLNVGCQVAVLGDGAFSVSLNMTGPDANGLYPEVSFTLNGTATPAGPTADNVASVSVFSPATGPIRTMTGSPGCTLGPVYVVKNGALLADFECPLLGIPDDPLKGCYAHGTVAVELCITGTEGS